MATHVVIGDGAAGLAGARAIRMRDGEATIAVISDDPQPHYYRAALTNYLFGQLRDEQLWGVPPDFYARLRIGRFHGRVTAIETGHRRVVLDSGVAVPYDRLLIAAGAAPARLTVPGADLPGVITFRTLQDARRIIDLAPEVRQAVIVGGGPLGMEWVQGLRHRGVDVVYVVREQRLMPRFLDAAASELVVRQLRAAGVTVLLQDEIAEIHPQPAGTGWGNTSTLAVAGVTTRSGRQIPGQLVGVAIGARPNLEFLRGSLIETDGGVITDRHLQTNVPGVYAAGDVARVRDARHRLDLPPAGLWQPARKQGMVAGANMAAPEPVEVYDPGAILHATHLYGLDFAGAGEVNPHPAERVEVLTAWAQPDAYRKVVLRDGRVAGCLLIGDRRGALLFKRLIDLGLDVSPVKDRLLDHYFDLAGWVHEHEVARTPQPMRLSKQAAWQEMAAAPVPGGAVQPRIEQPSAQPLAGRAARLIAGANVYHLPPDRAAVIGRDTACAVPLGNSSVSRRHAEIAPTPAGYTVRDLGSANGTWVGLTRLQPHVPHTLEPGDSLRLGQVFLTFALAEGEPDPAGQRPNAVLVGAQGPLVLQPQVTSIGRDLASDIVVPGTSTSRLHAQIRRGADGSFYLNDMGSMNGVLVNGGRIVTTHRLADGDVISIGGVQYTFRRLGDVQPAAPPAVLVAVMGADTGTRYPLTQAELVIGRDPHAAIVLDDPLVSRRHAAIRRAGDSFVIEDLGSSNGTIVNGAAVTGPRKLGAGDHIEIGQTRFIFHTESAAAQPPLPEEGPTSIVTPQEMQAALLDTRMEFATRTGAVPVLVLENGPRKGRRFPFTAGEEIIIGRDQACAIALPDQAVSRQHARLTVLPDGRAVLSDMGSRFGTLVNGTPLAGPHLLQEDDRITVAGTVLRFTWLP